jgi:hypothetical protein
VGRNACRKVVKVKNVDRIVWIARIIGILMLVGFMMMFASLQRRLVEMQGDTPPAASTST